jgi:predicted AlkP superfamily phosphohydrolase/phosphomutase
VQGLRTHQYDCLKEALYTVSRKQFAVVRHLLQRHEWDYFQFVEMGLDHIQHTFWKFHDPQHVLYAPGHPYAQVIRDYYLHLDAEVGQLLELLDDETAIVVASTHGAQRLAGGFCVNEWLVREGLLVLNEYPCALTPFSQLSVNWEKTRVWCEGGYTAQIFFNVQGREPRGTIAPTDYERFRDDFKVRLEALVDEQGQPLGVEVWKPEELYSAVRYVAPDLLAHFGGLSWQAVGSVGYATLHVQEDVTGPDGCSLIPYGSLILAAPNNPLQGAIEGMHLLHIAPTLLELGGYAIPSTMQGTSLLENADLSTGTNPGLSPDEETLIRERLSGLGYIA